MRSFEKNPQEAPPQPAPFMFDYKDPLSLIPFLDGGKINGARGSSTRRSFQRRLAKAVKKARALSLLPSSFQAYDNFQRPEPISPKPFDYK